MQLCNSKTYQSDEEVIKCEARIMEQIVLTDTFSVHDTLTVLDGLIQSSNKFFELAEAVVGENYLKNP